MRTYLVILLIGIALTAASCGKVRSGFNLIIAPGGVTTVSTATVFDRPLVVENELAAGTITVENDATHLYITYDVFGDWELKETALDATRWLHEIPGTRGGGDPDIGRFRYLRRHDPGTKSRTYAYSLWELRVAQGDTVYIAAHALVSHNGEEREAWGGLERFHSPNWANYLSYVIMAPAASTAYKRTQSQYITTERNRPERDRNHRYHTRPWRSPTPVPWQRCY